MTEANRISRAEFIALVATIISTIAFSIDAMLPAISAMAQELTPEAPNRMPLVVSSFMLGLGVGTLFPGPLSDSYGRRPVIIIGSVIYCLAALLAALSDHFEMIMVLRFIQGLGAAGPRVVVMAMVRDLYKGQDMARIMSLAMVFFMITPAIAPSIGHFIMISFGWRAIFISFALFSALSILWYGLRQPETLPPELRQKMNLSVLWNALYEMLSHKKTMISIMAQTFCYSCLVAVLTSIQPIFEIGFHRGAEFPLWFAFIATVSATANFSNTLLIARMRLETVVTLVLWVILGLSLTFLTIMETLPPHTQTAFYLYIMWNCTIFMMLGLTLGNLNSITMEPLGHIAGMASSVSGAVSMFISVIFGTIIGLLFDGTPLPLMIGVSVLLALGLGSMYLLPRH